LLPSLLSLLVVSGYGIPLHPSKPPGQSTSVYLPALLEYHYLGTEGGELVQILDILMLADLPYTVLKGAIYIHPTLAEGFFGLMDEGKPAD
jgi:hypothetical protein